jgi:dTDP-L-rhamnose 4-epimerase
VYAATKLAQEHILQAWAAGTGTAASILRLQNVYGPGQSLINPYSGVLTLFARLATSGQAIELYEDGGAVRDFVYIDDVIQSLVATVGSVPAGIRRLDIGSGMPTPLVEVAEFMAAREGAPSPVISGRFREGDVRAAWCDISAATTEINYSPAYDLQTGLARLLDWVRTAPRVAAPTRPGP